jgi:hypothetical protein
MKNIILIISLILVGCGGSGSTSSIGNGGLGGNLNNFNWCIAAGDVNGDGLTDLVVGRSYLAIAVQDPLHPGTFIGTKRPVTYQPYGIKIVDLNGDGRPDIITITDGAISVYLQDPIDRGTFPTEMIYTIPSRPATIRGTVDVLQVGDLNGDGKIDIATLDAEGVCVLFQDSAKAVSLLPCVIVVQSARINSLAIEDLNGDGLDDIAFGQSDQNKISIYTQEPTSKGSFIYDSEYSYPSPWYIYTGDLNGDNEPDIVVANPNSIGIFFQDVSQPGDFIGPTIYTLKDSLDRITIADLNKDGLNDIASISHDLDCMAIFIQGSTNPGTLLPPDYYQKSDPWDMTVGDLNNDGRLDVAMVSLDMTIVYFQDSTNPGKYLPLQAIP